MTSLERIIEFGKLPHEETISNNGEKFKNFPSSGKIEFKNVTAKYREDLKPSLEDLEFSIKSGEKIGICGR